MGCGASSNTHFRNPEAEGIYRLVSEKYHELAKTNPKMANGGFLPIIRRGLALKQMEDEVINLELVDYVVPAIAVQTLAHVLKVPTVISGLVLARCGLSDAFVQQLADALKSNNTLSFLDVSDNAVGPPGFRSIAQVLAFNQGLRVVRLSGNPAKDDGIIAIAAALRTNSTLLELGLARTLAEDAAAFALSSVIVENTRLRFLDMRDNKVGLEGCQELTTAMAMNWTMAELDLDGNSVPPIQLAHLYALLHRNREVGAAVGAIVDGALARIGERALLMPGGAGGPGTLLGIARGGGLSAPVGVVAPAGTPDYAAVSRASPAGPAMAAALLQPPPPPLPPPQLLPAIAPPVPMRRERRLRVGYADTVGRRLTMEDMIVIKRYFRGHQDEDFFAIFDGHGGHDAAEFAAENMHAILAQHLEAGQPPEVALRESFIECNNQMMKFDINDGTTAAVALFYKERLFVANAGDTRVVLSRGSRAIRLSFDHKADQPDEEARVNALGGFVTDSRVLGTLSVSRALGDFFLHPYVTAEPYITVTDIGRSCSQTRRDEFTVVTKLQGFDFNTRDTALSRGRPQSARFNVDGDMESRASIEAVGQRLDGPRVEIARESLISLRTLAAPADEFLVIACDGVWDVLTDEMAVAIVATEPDPVQSSLKLIDQAFLSGSTDNISVVIVNLY